jgi:uncharacterized membrane protein
MRLTMLTAILVSGLSMGSAMAQTVSAPKLTRPLEPAQAAGASLSHSAVKATTLKVATSITNFAVLSFATGGVVGGTALMLFNAASSWVIYTANDYAWDSYEPAPFRQDSSQSFDTTADAWRNTKKYLTFKPVVAAIKWASIFVYTGSTTTMVVFGLASSVTNAAVFYANNMAWDSYDWYSSVPPAAAVTKP